MQYQYDGVEFVAKTFKVLALCCSVSYSESRTKVGINFKIGLTRFLDKILDCNLPMSFKQENNRSG